MNPLEFIRRHCFKKAFLPAVAISLCLLVAQQGLWAQSPSLITELGFPFSNASLLPSPDITVADFNGDGIPDVATTLRNTGYTAVIYLGNGDGTFQEPSILSSQQAAGIIFSSIVSGDFNGDGKVDLCLIGHPTNGTLSTIFILPGNGDGTFQPAIISPQTNVGTAPQQNLATADFNGDGKLDIAISTSTPSDNTAEVKLLLGNGDGTFAAPSVVAGSSGSESLTTADWNHDGKPDLIWSSSAGVSVAFGDGTGGFSAPTNSPISLSGDGYVYLAVGDFNGDGIPDILTAIMIDTSPTAYSLSVVPGNGGGTFGTAITTSVPTNGSYINPYQIAIADFNGDGNLDLLVGNNTEGANDPNLLLFGNGDGTFTLSNSFSMALGTYYPSASASIAADFNGDGKPDVAFIDPNLMMGVLLNTPGTTAIGIIPAEYNFGNQTVGATAASTTITIGNPGTNPLSISNLAIDDTTDFSETDTCGSPIPAAGDCTVTVNFQPQSTGAKTANITFTSGNPLPAANRIHVTGQTIAPAISTSPATLAFSYQKVGTTSASQALHVTNSGVGSLTLSSISIQGDFQQTNNCPATLAQGASCTVTVVYAPEVPGSETGRVVFNTNAVPAQSAVPLTGIGYVIGPVLAISPPSLNFGTQYVGTSSAPGVITVQNNGDAPFSISSVTSTTGFVPLSTCGNNVQPSFSCAIGVFFDPVTRGAQTGSLNVITNLPTPTPLIDLEGTGTSITVGPSAASSTAATVAAGQSATYSMIIAPQSGYTGTVNLSCAGLPPGFTCTLSQSSVTLSGSAASTVTVTVATASAAATRASIARRGPGLLVLACPLAVFLVGFGMRSKRGWRLMALGALLVTLGAATSCGGGGTHNNGTTNNQTYAFFLESQPAASITVDTPLTLTVQTGQ